MKINRLEWDDQNLEHIISRHGISQKEVEDVCFGIHYACSAKYKRYAVYGQASSGRYLLVILERLCQNNFKPITARNMKQNERRKYNEIIK
jgi:uncharacterized DUF497 family protein